MYLWELIKMNENKEVQEHVSQNGTVVILRGVSLKKSVDQNCLLQIGVEGFSKTKLERWRCQSEHCNHWQLERLKIQFDQFNTKVSTVLM